MLHRLHKIGQNSRLSSALLVTAALRIWKWLIISQHLEQFLDLACTKRLLQLFDYSDQVFQNKTGLWWTLEVQNWSRNVHLFTLLLWVVFAILKQITYNFWQAWGEQKIFYFGKKTECKYFLKVKSEENIKTDNKITSMTISEYLKATIHTLSTVITGPDI